MKYQTKLLIVAALQLSYATAEDIQDFIGSRGDVRSYEEHDLAVLLDTPGGLLVALPTDYVVETESGELAVYKEHDFINRFESAEDLVDTGAALAEALKEVKVAQAEVVALVKRAEDAEKLAEALKKQLAAKTA